VAAASSAAVNGVRGGSGFGCSGAAAGGGGDCLVFACAADSTAAGPIANAIKSGAAAAVRAYHRKLLAISYWVSRSIRKVRAPFHPDQEAQLPNDGQQIRPPQAKFNWANAKEATLETATEPRNPQLGTFHGLYGCYPRLQYCHCLFRRAARQQNAQPRLGSWTPIQTGQVPVQLRQRVL
jgi:hypothetical protein